jgi:hypothetical protein
MMSERCQTRAESSMSKGADGPGAVDFLPDFSLRAHQAKKTIQSRNPDGSAEGERNRRRVGQRRELSTERGKENNKSVTV